MNIESIIDQLIERNIELQVKDGNLVLAGERERLTEALLSGIRENKEAIIAYLRQLQETDVTAVSSIGQAPLSEGYVLSSSQRRLWILSQFEGGSSAYHLGGAYTFRGALDAAALGRALQTLSLRHESLRTTFAAGPEGIPLQYIHPPHSAAAPTLQQLDLRDASDLEAAARAAVAANAEATFDLEQGPLLRVVLLQLPEDTWVLGYALHHLISDGWSMPILLRELLTLYNAYAGGAGEDEALALLPALPIQYKDYAYWQQEQLRSGVLAGERAYWLDRFKGEVPVLELPQDGVRPAVRRYKGAVIHRRWSSLGSFTSLVQQGGATLFMGLLAVVEAVLYRYTGQEDLIVGTPIAGRSHADVQGGIGFYVNTLALRTRVEGSKNFKTLLAEVRQACLEGYEHQGYPFDELVEELGLRRDTGRHPLFDVMMVLQQTAHRTEEGQGLSGVSGSGFDEGGEAVSSKFDLSFVFTEVGEGLSLMLEYDSALYEEARMERLCTHLEGMLQAVTAYPDEAVDQLHYFSSEERHQLLEGFNATSTDYPKDATLVRLFEESVAAHPEAIALVHGEEQITYTQLNERANAVAHYLIEAGIQSDELVGVCLERGVTLIAALLGILKAGGGYVPIDPEYPQERIRYMIEDSGCRLVLDEQKLNAIHKESHQHTNPNLSIQPHHAAYVIYTSGTTGRPKGVLIEHRNVVNLIISQASEFGITTSDNILQLSSIIFDASVEQIFLALTAGARLTLVSKAQLLDTTQLEQLILREGITHLHSVPSFLNLLEAKPYPSLRRVIAGGEACDEKLARRWATHCTFYNEYGPTETTVTSIELKYDPGTANPGRLPIGRPIANTQVYILNHHNELQPIGIPGEIHIGGAGVARGYLNREELTTEKFIADPYKYGERLYRTGDWGQWRADGTIDFIGRKDQQVKLNGYRIELEEITRTVAACPGIDEALVLAETSEGQNTGLHAFFTSGTTPAPASLRAMLKEKLPAYMVPDAFTQLPAFPKLANGKTNTEALRRLIIEGVATREEDTKPLGTTEEQLALLVTSLLPGKQEADVTTNFFDLGLNSLRIIRLAHAASKHFSTELNATKLFQYTSIRRLAAYIDSIPVAATAPEPSSSAPADRAIAIVGLSCQFPGSPDAAAFWKNICEGRELISHFSKEELLQAGMTEATFNDPSYVPSFGSLADKDCFDHRFFGYRREEAEYMDPQVRLFHEHSWKALEDAGYAPQAGTLKIGLFAGASDNQNFRTYMHLRPKTGQVDPFFAGLVSEQRNISSLVSYKLDLRGPSVYLYTACSTSLTAVHLACESLLSGECGLALAGGVSLSTLRQKGYHYEEGMVLSADGHCRTFDKEASGTVGGEGVGIVVLKPLDVAIRDRDHIYAVIRGSSMNNDGSGKIGYTAPGIEGQSDCIAKALNSASIDPSSIDFIETHGTATRLGDPIEVEALVQAFGKVEKKQYCAIGSVKSNMGHLDVAAGVASLIKTALALHHGQLPPSIHFNSPNPAIDFANSPFFVNTSLRSWERSVTQRRYAGVSSFGIGGTNLHMILEDRPPEVNTNRARSRQLLLLSARTPGALTRSVAAFRSFLPRMQEEAAADMTYTLQVGRRHFEYRLALAFSSLPELEKKLEEILPTETVSRVEKNMRPIVFAFPGQASQYVNMGRDLYDREPYFRQLMDEGFARLEALTGKDFKAVLFAGNGSSPIDETFYTQPIVFLFGYALAKLLMYWGIRPQYLIGHSLGEYVAACIGGVFGLPEALSLVVTRAGLMSGTGAGAMLSVHASEEQVNGWLPAGCSVAAVNGAKQTVVSGEPKAIAQLADTLNGAGISTIPLRTAHAYHSHLLDPVLDTYRAEVEKINLQPPVLPFVSNLSGAFITNAEAVSADYWVRHMREPVKFAAGIGTLMSVAPDAVVIEVGAGRTLISLMREHRQLTGVQLVRSQREAIDDADLLCDKLALLWLSGVAVDWQRYNRDFPARRISLPTYSFEKTRHLTEVDPFDLVRVNRHAPVAMEPLVVEEVVDELPPGRSLKAPETPTEEKLVALYAGFFETPHISVDDSFIELGGDSLKAMVVIKRIREELGVPVALKDFFNAADIRALAQLVDETTALMRKSTSTGKSKKII